MTGQSTTAAERSAHAPAGSTEAPAWITQVSPGVWRMTAYVDLDKLRAEPGRIVGGMASARVTVQTREGATVLDALTLIADYARHVGATPAQMRATAATLCEMADARERGE